jgi:hypothetical protein
MAGTFGTLKMRFCAEYIVILYLWMMFFDEKI